MISIRKIGVRAAWASPKRTSSQGFALLEAVMGILVIGITILAVTPPILLAVATRVQNRRAEQAMQLAQSEVDRVRVLVEQGNYTVNDLPAVPAISLSDITNVSAPNSLSNTIKSNNRSCSNLYNGTLVPDNTALQVDVNKNCKPEFLVQTFRDSGVTIPVGNNQVVMAFRMGVRVYAAVAAENGQLTNLDTKCASLKFTTGLGSQRSRPLAVIYTALARSDSNLSLDKYKQLLPTPAPSPSLACGKDTTP